MKSIFIYIFVLIATFSVPAFSQTTDLKIAAINTDRFSDKQNGIREFVEALDKFETELEPKYDELSLLAEKGRKLTGELKSYSEFTLSYPRNIIEIMNKKAEEFKELQTEYKEKDDRLRLLANKFSSEILTEPRKKIRDAIKQFAKEHGFAIILDSSKDVNSVIIQGEVVDVTQNFIEFYNKNHAGNK